ncbi:MAG TPA: twin-arginine translocase subunit TatC [Nocardioidaceae bacterium]|nr:twin-arginine translocase subunit TatC [Nocardioidaceae bacterium]
MSTSAVLRMFRVRPETPMPPDGRMALADHLRELRGRILRVVALLVVATVVALFFYDQLFGLILRPYNEARSMLGSSVRTKPVITGAGTALLLQLKICALAAVVVASPYWLYQIWAFILPGLHPNEKRWTRAFAAIAGPLFVVGVGIGYYVLPKGLSVLIGFTPAHVQNLLEFNDYFTFFTRMLLVFGVAFEVPLFVVLLNLAGVVSGRTLAKYRPWIVVGVFVFAAVATPSTDPFSMLMLAIPMVLLFMVSELIARLVDRRRRRADELADYDDDEISPLESRDDDYRVSDLSEEDD